MTERKMKWSLHSYTFEPNGGTFKEKTHSEYEEIEDKEYGQEFQITNRILDTPLGLFIADDDLNPYKQFEFWVGHTNFDITQEVKDIIMSTPGVEVFELITRYRFIIGIGALFAFAEVRASLQQQLCGTSVDFQHITSRVNELKKTFAEGEYEDYAIYIFPNGEIDFCYLDKDKKNLEEFQLKKKLLIESQDLSKGQLHLHEPREPVTETQ